jgi:hypothetical protein
VRGSIASQVGRGHYRTALPFVSMRKEERYFFPTGILTINWFYPYHLMPDFLEMQRKDK